MDSGAAPLPAWHLWLDETPRPGWANMAIDQCLLDRVEQFGESWLRLYYWAPHCLSFGRHEPATRRYDRERIMALGLNTVRRPTGGRAVWHAQELTYAVAAPSPTFGSLGTAYREIHRMLADALCAVGAPAYLAPAVRTPPIDAGACFLQAVGGEVMVGQRKVVGSAQLRQGGALLQHGSILLQDNQNVVFDLTRDRQPQHHTTGMPAPWARGPDIAEAVTAAAARRWPAAWERGIDEAGLLSSAFRHYPRYQSAAWTWAR
jgi:lipoyl(octanoyl) transferase